MGSGENVPTQEGEPPRMGEAYQYCTREECEERQELKQVHELEATLETCSLPQAKRILDPRLAVSKFKRSAAGTCARHVKGAQLLGRTLAHLRVICATRRATPGHPPCNDLQNWAEFVVDRLRAAQSDATRLSSTNDSVSRAWHLQLVRILIWIRYWTHSLDESSWIRGTVHTMIGTATESYWGQQGRVPEGLSHSEENLHLRMDDEMLCWSTLLQISQQQERQLGAPMHQNDSGRSSILLDFSRFSATRKSSDHPLWCQSLSLSSHLGRHEYYAAWKKIARITESFESITVAILFKCCIEPNLSLWRYRTLQQYNKSFAKEEEVTSVPRLLSIHADEWNMQRAAEFGLPAEEQENGEIALIFKRAPLDDDGPKAPKSGSRRARDHRFTFGQFHDPKEKMSISGVHSMIVLRNIM